MAQLTDEQAAAVNHTEGPLLILAAAGSGKTRVITHRIAHLLSLDIPASSICALTFTNKAAGEMRERVQDLLASDPLGERRSRGLTVATFHSLCARMLRRYAPLMAGRPDWPIDGDFTIYATDDQLALMKQTIKQMDLDTSNWSPRSVLSAISDAKNTLKTHRDYEHEAADFYARTIAKIFNNYSKALAQANAIDFDDLLLLTVRVLREHPEARAEVNDRFRYLMIDEYQDTNHAQFVLASLLIGSDEGVPPNIAVVGDPDQSIYGWRGADISNILDFEKHYPDAAVIALGQNFRSTAPILSCADHLIQHNVRRKHKPLFTKEQGGAPVEVTLCRDEQHEAESIAEWFKALHEGLDPLERDEDGSQGRDAFRWRDMAVMYRNNALSRVVEDHLRRSGIPYVVARGTAFYQREEVKDALSYLRVVANPADEVSLRRIVNKPARKISKPTVQTLEAFAARQGITLFEALKRAEETSLAPPAVAACHTFVEMISDWTAGGSFMGAHVPTTLRELTERIVRESQLEQHYAKLAKRSGNESDLDKVENLSEMISSAAQFDDEYDPAADPALDPFDFFGELSEDEMAAAAGETNDQQNADESGEPASAGPETPPLLARLRAYLESVSLVADADRVDTESGAVTLLTLHAAKGLEFPAVAIVGLEEGTLPGMRALDSDEQLEEERRLAFVGITRAMKRLHLSSARYRTLRGSSQRTIPSRFIEELPEKAIVTRDRSDVSAGLGSSWGGSDDDAGFDDFPVGARGGSKFGARGDFDDMDQRPPEERMAETKPRRRRTAPTGPKLREGQRVRHPQFGLGTVLEVHTGMNARAKVRFEDTGTKTIILQYTRLEPA